MTPENHPDYVDVAQALEEMATRATVINEEKRNFEEVARIQETIEGWDGIPLVDTSSRLIYNVCDRLPDFFSRC